MLGFLKTLSKFALYGLLLATVGAGLILFVWWMGWPLFSVAVVVSGAGLLVLLFMAARQLRIFVNKRRYVHHVLTADPSLQQRESTEHSSPMSRAWERGMSVFGRSPRGLHGNAVYAQPWVIQLGGKGCLADSQSTAAPLNWHFLPDMVLLELNESVLSTSPTGENTPAHAASPEQQAEWEFLLSRLLETRQKDAPEALVAAIDVSVFADPDQLTSRARQLHARLRELQTLFEARIPLYVAVTGLDTLPGMPSLLDSFTDAQRGEMLGERFPLPDQNHVCHLPPETCAARAVEQAVRRLRRMLLARAAEGFPPDGDELLAFSAISNLESGLAAFLHPLFRLTPHVAAPLLRGIVFITGATRSEFIFDTESASMTGFPAAVLVEARPLSMAPAAATTATQPAQPRFAAKPGFTAELLSCVLPSERPIRQSTGQSSLRGRLTGLCFGCWYLALFVFCGLAATATVYNWHTLRNAPTIADGADNAFLRLRHFEDAERRWWLPSLGLDSIGVERDAASARFLADMRRQIPGTLSGLVNATGPLGTRRDSASQLERMQHLLWLSEAVDLRRKGSTTALREQPFPAAAAGEELWTPTFGDAFLNYLDRENTETLAPLTASLRVALQQILGRDERLLFERLAEFVNLNLAHKSVTLAEFWPNIPRGSNAFMVVQPIYTAAGFADLAKRMDRLYADQTYPTGQTYQTGQTYPTDQTGRGEESYTAKPFWKHYLADYAAAWQAFALNSDRAWSNESTAATLENLTAETELIKTPSARQLNRMARELQPLAGVNAPDWVGDVFLLNALLEITALTGDTDPGEKLGTLSILLGSLKTSGPALTQVRDYLLATRDARSVFRAVSALREYEQSLQELRRTLLSPEGSLTLAAMHFGGKQYGDATQSASALAETQLGEVFRILHIRPDVGRVRPGQTNPPALSPAAATLRGQLRLSMHGVITEAALQLQRQWESGVLATATLAPLNPGPLFAEQGVVRQFLTDRAAPFVERKVGGYVPRTWDGQPFPFTDDFLQFAQQGQAAALVTPKEVYEVRLRSQTSAVNPEAKERLQYVEVSLEGADGPAVLKNQNYPAEKTFTYKPAASGGVTLGLSFPSLTLTRTYADFADFLQEFAYGERVFSAQDFPESAERMEFLNINSITVRILPVNAGEVLAAQAITPMPLPERITKVW